MNRMSGSVALVVGESDGSVTLPYQFRFVAKDVTLKVRKPAVGRMGLVANLIGSPTEDGFSFELANGAPDETGYFLDYEISGEYPGAQIVH